MQRAGGGPEERLEFAPRGFFDIGRRNLGGRNRSVNLFTRVSVRPKDVPDDPEADGRGLALNEYRVVGTYREPAAILWNADLMLTGAVEQGQRTSFNFVRKGVSAELLRRITRTIRTSGRYSFGTTRTFDERLSEEEQSQIDRLFPQVRLSLLDRSRTRVGEPDAAALSHTVERAQRAEELGYHRFWVAEHHAVPGIASGSPPVLIAAVAARTERIRVGSGGVMLPNHQPLVVAEQFAMLEALYPGRIDLGVGRSLGFTHQVADSHQVGEGSTLASL